MTRTAPMLILALLAGCASQPLRFHDRPIVWSVTDTASIALPRSNDYAKYAYMGDVFVLRRGPRVLELPTYQLALGTNALDEVPDSSWFTNRIGVRAVTPEEAARGPEGSTPPVLPWTVVAGKTGGGNAGFVAEDATGRKFVVKFDPPGNPEQQTATDVIVGRIFWTLGYNVPSDHLSVFSRGQLHIGPHAEIKSKLGDKRPMTHADLEEILAKAARQPDGRIRAVASELLPGKPLGGVPPEGVREDDPNDVIPHQHRRELRAMRVIGAWLNHTDMKEDNTLDVYVEEGGRGFVRHYFIDFGEAMGAHASEKGRMEDGYEHFFDWERQFLGLVSFGFWVRDWEHLEPTPWPSIGAFTSAHFDPEGWREAYPYWPIVESGVEDWFWAAKLIMRVDRPLLEAMVAVGELSVPEAEKYLVDTLVERRDMIGRVYLDQLTPLDALELRAGQLCAVDLAVRYGFADARTSVIERLGEDDEVIESAVIADSGLVCWDAPREEAYTVLRLRARRGEDERPVMQVHLIGGPRARILGLVRKE